MGSPLKLNLSFTAPLRQDDTPGSWTIVVLPDSSRLLGTRRPVKVSGEIDGHEFTATLLPMGDGSHMVPVRKALRIAVGKAAGEQVTVRLLERVG